MPESRCPTPSPAAAAGLVDHDPRMGKRGALAGPSRRQQERSHACRQAHAVGVNRRLQELHRVVDRQARRDAAARGVDVDVDVALRIIRLQEEQLRDHNVGHVIIDRRAEEDDPVHEEPGENIVGSLAAARALDDVRRVDRRHLFFFFPFRH